MAGEIATWQEMGVYENGGTFLGSLSLRESYDLGVCIRGSPIIVDPQVASRHHPLLFSLPAAVFVAFLCRLLLVAEFISPNKEYTFSSIADYI